MTCYCGAPIESPVPHPSGEPTYCSVACRRDAILAGIAEHLDTLAETTTSLAFLWGESR